MIIDKKRNVMNDLELSHLMTVREMWRSAKSGLRVCVVTVYECGWETILGDYRAVMQKYVDQGLIYHRVEDTLKPELQLVADDLENVLITMEMI